MANPTSDPKERYKRWHWGVNPTHQVHVEDERFPDEMVEIGRLMELRFNSIDTPDVQPNPKQVIELDENAINSNFVVFDNGHPKERIYFILDGGALKDLKKIYRESGVDIYPLNTLAEMVGGGT